MDLKTAPSREWCGGQPSCDECLARFSGNPVWQCNPFSLVPSTEASSQMQGRTYDDVYFYSEMKVHSVTLDVLGIHFLKLELSHVRSDSL